MTGNLLHDILTPDAAERHRPRDRLSLREWTQAVNYTIDGNPCDLSRIPYVNGIYDDDQASVYVFRKGSQVAVTSWALAKALHGADELGMRWIYFLPTDEEMKDFVADRVKGVLDSSDYLRSRVGDTDNAGLKKVGNSGGLIYYRGLWTKRRAKSVPADGLIFDEVDEINPENVVFAEDRVLASLNPKRIYLSVPSFSNYGIDKMFADTDQRFYLIKCKSCGEWANIDEEFPNNFLEVPHTLKRTFSEGATHYRGCRWCGAKLDISAGEWVARRPGVRWHGYHVSRLYALVRPPDYANVASYIMDEFRKSLRSQHERGRFVIAFLGRPFDGEGARINDELLESLEEDQSFLYTGQGCFMGVDQGDNLDISIYTRIGDRLALIYCENTQEWGRLNMLMERYKVVMAGIDGNPNRNNAKEFAAKWKKRAFIQDFGGDELKEKIALFEGKNAVDRITVDRTQSLDSTVDFVEGRRLILPERARLSGKDQIAYKRYRDHLCNLKSKLEDTPRGRRVVYLDKIANHHGMGLNTARIAAFERGVKAPTTGTMPVFLEWGNA